MSLQIWLPLNKDLSNKGTRDSVVTANNATYNTSNGKLGGCYSFNGSNSYLLGTHNFISNNTDEWTFACWMRVNNTSPGCLFSCRTVASDAGITVFYYGSQWIVDDGTRWQFTPTVTIAKDTWYHICVVRKKGVGKYLYVNGTLDSSTTSTGTPTLVNTSQYAIGSAQINATEYGYGVNGYLNDVRFYDNCLSVAEIKELAKGLVCHYKLSSDGNDNLLKYTHVNATNKNLLKTNINSSWNNLPITTIDGHDCYQYPTAQSPTWFSSGHWFEPMEANTTYTYTAWIYFTANANFNFTSLGHFQVYNANSTASDKSHEDVVASRIYEPSTIQANTWTKVRITFTTNSLAGSYFQIYPRYNIAANTGELYFRDCKLEKNGSPTEWVPNSADVEYSGMGYDSTIMNDCSGYGYNGTKSGTLSRYNDSPRYDSSTTFVDSNSSVTVTPYLSDGQKVYSISVSCWFRTNTMNGGLPNLWSLGENSFLRIRLASATSIWYYARVGSTMVGLTYAAGKTLTDNTWHHVVLTFLNGVFVMYLDGVQIGTTDSSSTATYLTCSSVGATWHLAGYTATTESYVGQLSDFRIYTSALSAADVKTLYDTGARVSKTGAMLSYEVKEEG